VVRVRAVDLFEGEIMKVKYRLVKMDSKFDASGSSRYIIEKRKSFLCSWTELTKFYSSGDGEAIITAKQYVAQTEHAFRPQKVLTEFEVTPDNE
jgi:hypothetical protein